MNSNNGNLQKPHGDEGGSQDYKLEVVTMFKSGKIKEARQLLCKNARPEEMEEMFRWMYDNIDLWGNSDEQRDAAIIVIRNGLVNHAMVADPEINLSATLCELTQL